MIFRIAATGLEVTVNGTAFSATGVRAVEYDGSRVVLQPAPREEALEYGLTYLERKLVEAGAFIHAIKAVRERTLLGLKESKDRVDTYRSSRECRAGMVATHQHLGALLAREEEAAR